CSTRTRRFKSMETLAQRQASLRCCCKVTRERSNYCPRYRRRGPMEQLQVCARAVDSRLILFGRTAHWTRQRSGASPAKIVTCVIERSPPAYVSSPAPQLFGRLKTEQVRKRGLPPLSRIP